MNEEIYRNIVLVVSASLYLLGVFYVLASEYISETDYFFGPVCALAGVFAVFLSTKKFVSLLDKIFAINQLLVFVLMVFGIFILKVLFKRLIVFFIENKQTPQALDDIFIKQNPL